MRKGKERGEGRRPSVGAVRGRQTRAQLGGQESLWFLRLFLAFVLRLLKLARVFINGNTSGMIGRFIRDPPDTDRAVALAGQ